MQNRVFDLHSTENYDKDDDTFLFPLFILRNRFQFAEPLHLFLPKMHKQLFLSEFCPADRKSKIHPRSPNPLMKAAKRRRQLATAAATPKAAAAAVAGVEKQLSQTTAALLEMLD